ncbi:hypothetical protein BSK66_10735 [Paenibacillus odorifer]|uniref:class I SAM-dependent methyltransferase n=1 Tax=Paenibacillus TaxID=44249 RepID=UPI0003E1EF47|nr:MULTISPECIES: class I SAM-dependent methyltransferase [Paenibacillus]ETT65582.1 wsae [Paenibacillus sp. FSL H8-237]OME56557.1 hypothetical protein BSK59_11850 [Paenibacillus odorifer]OME59137.1 hypothetical protein BSK66_10735 [Paenibacillus odorifer]
MIPFHQFQRYKMVEIIFELLGIKELELSILEVGANEHKNLENFVENKNIKYLDLLLPEELLNDPSFIQGDATNLSFDNNYFDFVIGLDVLEHIPLHKRNDFLSEIERVSKYGFIISAPFSNNGIEEVEERLGAFFHYLYNGEILWSKEHQENGLPDLQLIKDKMDEFNGEWNQFNHASIFLFEKFMQMEFKTGLHPDIYEYWNTVNSFYNEKLFYKDFNNEESVRTFIIYGKNGFEKRIDNLPSLFKKISAEMTSEDYAMISHHENMIDFMSTHKMNADNNKKNGGDLDKDNLYLQIYWDDGQGYSESKSESFKVEKSQKVFQVNFDLPALANKIRIDPSATKCIIEILDLELTNQDNLKNKEYTLSSNAFSTENNQYMFLNNDPQIVIEVMQGTYIRSVSCLLKYSTPVLDISENLISKLQANSDWEHTKYKYMNFVKKLRMKNQTLKTRIKNLKLTNEDLIQRNQEMQEMNESRENWFDDEFKKKDEVLKMIELNNLGISKEKSELEKEIEAIKNRKAYKLITRLEPIIDKLRRRKND